MRLGAGSIPWHDRCRRRQFGLFPPDLPPDEVHEHLVAHRAATERHESAGQSEGAAVARSHQQSKVGRRMLRRVSGIVDGVDPHGHPNRADFFPAGPAERSCGERLAALANGIEKHGLTALPPDLSLAFYELLAGFALRCPDNYPVLNQRSTTPMTPGRTHAETLPPVDGRMPVVFLPHGAGPWPFVDLGFADRREVTALGDYLHSLSRLTAQRPRALLVISAHWEAPVPTVMTAAHPPLYYDYYGFPKASYEITWPAPGAPHLAARVQALLGEAGIATAADGARGFDHGTFIPLKLAFPDADVPTIQLSLKQGLDPAAHLAIGRALAPLRDEGVLLVGSGMSYHDLRGFGGRGAAPAAIFDAWLNGAVTTDAEAREQALRRWASAPMARQSHPREEHLLPLMVVAGAALADRGRRAFNGHFAGVMISAFHFGEGKAERIP